jgi:hypothetical protein
MALQTSGAISISQIKTELGSSSNSLRALSAAAGKSAPDAMSEFYGYSSLPPLSDGFNLISNTNMTIQSQLWYYIDGYSNIFYQDGAVAEARVILQYTFDHTLNISLTVSSEPCCDTAYVYFLNDALGYVDVVVNWGGEQGQNFSYNIPCCGYNSDIYIGYYKDSSISEGNDWLYWSLAI